LLGLVVVPLVLAAVACCLVAPYPLPWLRWLNLAGPDAPWSKRWWVEAVPFALAFAVVAGSSAFLASRGPRPARGAGAAPTGAWWWRLTAGLAGGLLLYGAYCFLHSRFHWDGTEPLEYVQARATAQLTTFGPPLVLLAIVLGVYLGVGLQKDRLGEELR